MYANRYADGPRFRPASLGVALAINGGLIAGLLLASPEVIPGLKPKPPIILIEVDPPKPPPPDPKPDPRTSPQPRPSSSVTTPDRPPDLPLPPYNPPIGDPRIGPIDPGNGPVIADPPADPPSPPRLVAAQQDPRYADDFQPPYPDFEREAGREDLVKLRIRIGPDGRVKQVERLAGRDSFARVAMAHALAKWRFKPAIRGDVPEESWKVMTVRFTLND